MATPPTACLLTGIVLHHDRRHSPVAGMARLVAVTIGVGSVHVGHVALVLCQGGRELHVWGAGLLARSSVLLRRQLSPALRPLLGLLFLEALLRPLALLLRLPVALSLPVVLPPLVLLRFGGV